MTTQLKMADSHAVVTDAELEAASAYGWVEATLLHGDQELGSLRAVADLLMARLAAPAIHADLRALLEALVAAYAMRGPADPDAMDAKHAAVNALITWTHAHG